jgi:hypothetical protein
VRRRPAWGVVAPSTRSWMCPPCWSGLASEDRC